MGGTWNPTPPPVRPGFYLNYETAGSAAVATGDTGIVGLPITADWGPVNEFVLLTSDALYKQTFGPNNVGASYLVQEAFRGGAAQVLAYRVTDGTEAPAALDLIDESGSGSLVVAEVQDGGGGFDEEQSLTLGAGVTGGTFTLDFNDGATTETTAPIPYNATAAQVEAALEALANVGAGNVTAAGGPLGAAAVNVTFVGALSDTSFADMVADTTGLITGADVVINLVAKHPGARGNSLRVVIEDNPLASITNPKTDIKIYEGNDLREKYTYSDLDHADLVARINDVNKGSDYVIATLDSAHPEYPGPYTTRLARNLTGSYLSGGSDGISSPMPISVWTDAMDAFERQGGFDIFTLPDVHDNDYLTPGITAAVVDWTAELNDKGQYVTTVIGGDAVETVDESVARSAGADSEWIVNVGRTDLRVTYPLNTVPGQDSLGRVDRRPAALTTRVAGQVAAAGVTRAITFANMAAPDSPVEIINPMTLDEIEEAITNGVIVFTKRGPRVVIEDGVTSFTTYTEEKDATFGNLKAVRTMQKIGRDFTEVIETGYIGQQNNTATTRSNLINLVQGYLGNLESQGVIIPGSQVLLDDRFNNTRESIHLLLLVQFSRELKRVLMTLRAPLL